METLRHVLWGVKRGLLALPLILLALNARGNYRQSHSPVLVEVPDQTTVRKTIPVKPAPMPDLAPVSAPPQPQLQTPMTALPAVTVPSTSPHDGDCLELFYDPKPVNYVFELNAQGKKEQVPVLRWFVDKAPCTKRYTHEQAKFLMGEFPLFPVMLTDYRKVTGERTNKQETQMMLSSLAGMRDDPTTQKTDIKVHEGWDIRARKGTPIVAPYDAVVTDISSNSSCGKRITLDFQGKGIVQATFCHLSAYPVELKVGSRVKREEVVGFSGATGNATRGGVEYPHIHLQLKVDFEMLAKQSLVSERRAEREHLAGLYRQLKSCKLIESDAGKTIDPFCFTWVFKHQIKQQKPPTLWNIAASAIKERLKKKS